MSFEVDLFVIGAGSGGVRAARIAAGYGARVMVAEEFRIGGTCVIRGCVPKKLLVYASRFADDFADAAGYGWRVGETAFRLADHGRRQGKRNHPPFGDLPRQSRKSRRRDDRGARRSRGPAIGAARRRPADQRQAYSDRHRRRARSRAGDSRPRARDLLERNLRSQNLSQPPAGRRRRLYRGRIRLGFRPARRER